MPYLTGIHVGTIADAMKVEARAVSASLRRAVEQTGRQVQDALRTQVRAAGFSDGSRAMAYAW